MIQVKVIEIGGVFEKLEVVEGSTVRQVLVKAKANVGTEKQITMNDNAVTLDDIVTDGAYIKVVPQVKGN